MKLSAVLIGGMLVMAAGQCGALPACAEVVVPPSVEVAEGTFTLADLMAGTACGRMREAAAQVNLGVSPRAGRVRVFEGQQVRELVAGLAGYKVGDGKSTAAPIPMQVPERVAVRRAGMMKTCGEIAESLARSALWRDSDGDGVQLRQHLDCAAAGGVPEEAQLELIRANRNEALQRWEFSLRCAKPETCVPFMVWTQEEEPHREGPAQRREPGLAAQGKGESLLVRPGQTATLIWDKGGIRVILPVTCLEAGARGQVVRVRLKNVVRTLRAEVMEDGTLQVRL
ncbi:MAG: flagella basal body P-ring formation protein FlgA [Candidatus Sulfotelmatobacter sp.]|jgi:hypothetical protein